MQLLMSFNFQEYILIAIFFGKAVFSENINNSKESVRLPRNLKPKLYQLEIKPYLSSEFSFEAKVIISFDCIEDTDKIVLHSKNLTVYEDKVKIQFENDETPIAIKQHEYNIEKDFYILHLNQNMKAGKSYQIKIDFKGILGTQLIGFYRASYNVSSTGEQRWLALTQFEPIYARQSFVCFDEPDFKAAFLINVTRNANMTALSNMPLKSTTDSLDGWVTDHFEETPPMSTYLVAFIVFDFGHLDSPDGKFRVWARKEALALGQANYALSIGPKIQNYFEQYFGIKFPLPKQDLVAIPDFYHGAMENFGLVTFRETSLLYDQNSTSDSGQIWVAHVISHELSHQWFGNLVTMKWFDGLWLNEGFASYVEYLGVNEIEPSWTDIAFFVINEMYPVLDFDAWNFSHSIWANVENPDEIDELFDFISYKKGASVIRMMSNFLTQNTMRKGLSNYLEKWKYANTIQEDLWDAMTEQGHKENTLSNNVTVKEIMDTWTIQKGFPIVNVIRTYDGTNKVKFTQEIFTHSKNADNMNSTWWIPISFSTPQINSDFEKTQAIYWLTNQGKSLEIEMNIKPDQWLIINVQQTGFYRVNYDDQNWQLIKSQLAKDFKSIHLINRAQIINDLFNIARNSLVTYELAFDVTMFIREDIEYVPWQSFLSSISYIDDILSTTPAYGDFKEYVRRQMEIQYEKFGFHLETPRKTRSQKLHRASIIGTSCYYGIERCIDFAKSKFSEWMNSLNPDTENNIRKNFRSSVYCTGLRYGSQKEWDFIYERYLNSKVASEKSVLLGALSCSREIWILNRFLKLTITSESSGGIAQQYVTTVLGLVAKKAIGAKLVLQFLDDNWDRLFKRLGKSGLQQLDGVFRSVAGRLNSPSELKQFESVTGQGSKDFGPATLSVKQAYERIKTNIDWISKYYEKVSKWMVTHNTNI